MNNDFYLINAFTNQEFTGNPAAIIILSEQKSDEWMTTCARELNQPITSFVTKSLNDNYQLRWFTPKEEVDLCGHGTLGAAHVLWNEGLSLESVIHFHTNSGILLAEKKGKEIMLTFKRKKTSLIRLNEQLRDTLNYSIRCATWAEDRYLVELDNEEAVHNAIPNLEYITKLDGNGLIITSLGSGKYDFVSRYFAPKIGVDEDYVTGSAHCALASYWQEKLNKNNFMAYQDSERGGEIKLTIDGDYVQLTGSCITLLNGKFNM